MEYNVLQRLLQHKGITNQEALNNIVHGSSGNGPLANSFIGGLSTICKEQVLKERIQ